GARELRARARRPAAGADRHSARAPAGDAVRCGHRAAAGRAAARVPPPGGRRRLHGPRAAPGAPPARRAVSAAPAGVAMCTPAAEDSAMLRSGLVALILALPAPAQDEGCRACHGEGVRECTGHKALADEERKVLACSEAMQCKQCHGVLRRDCQSCANPKTDAELQQRVQDLAAWLAERRKSVDAITGGKEIRHLKTANLDLAFSVRPLTVGRVKLDTHALMHLYAQRIEDLRTLFQQTFGCTDKDFSGRLQIYLFKDQLDHQ